MRNFDPHSTLGGIWEPKTMLLVPKPRGVQYVSDPSVARLMHAIFIVNKTSSSVTVSPTKQGPCSDNARSGPTPEAIYKILRAYVLMVP